MKLQVSANLYLISRQAAGRQLNSIKRLVCSHLRQGRKVEPILEGFKLTLERSEINGPWCSRGDQFSDITSGNFIPCLYEPLNVRCTKWKMILYINKYMYILVLNVTYNAKCNITYLCKNTLTLDFFFHFSNLS